MSKNKIKGIYGFEDYSVIRMGLRALFEYNAFSYYYFTPETTILPTNDLDTSVTSYYGRISFSPNICENHKELLDTAEKLYIHPSCKLSRSLVAEKYKKSLNPWVADAVVIPKFSYYPLSLTDATIFISEEKKTIIYMDHCYYEDAYKINNFERGTLFKDIRLDSTPIEDWIANSELLYTGKVLIIPEGNSYILDAIMHSFPGNKTVFEDSVQESLSTEDNKITLEILLNIKDMLESTDENTVSAGLKALSMLDYMHYPKSINYMLDGLTNTRYRWNKTMHSTSVKFMFKQLLKCSSERSIYPQDFELIKQYIAHYNSISIEDVNPKLLYCEFMTVDPNGMLIPILK
jgi:hypothetical protein